MENNKSDYTIESQNVDLNKIKPYIINIDNIFLDVAVQFSNDQLLEWHGIKAGS